MKRSKALILVVCALLLVSAAFVGTLAWLTDKTEDVKNTFTVGNINIDLDETDDLDLKMIPGKELDKDPSVTVKAGSEDCYVFVKVEKNATYNDYLEDYVISANFELLESDGLTKVYWRLVEGVDSDLEFVVLGKAGTTPDVGANGSVVVRTTVTSEMMEAITDGTVDAPTLTFTAYAIQKEGMANAAAAWAALNA